MTAPPRYGHNLRLAIQRGVFRVMDVRNSVCFRSAQRCGIVSVAVALICGCGGPKPTTRPAAANQAQASGAGEDYDVSSDPSSIRTHSVGAYETLFQLAQRYYGDGKHWRRIFYANRNRINDPNNLPVGMKLIIPPR